MGAWLQVLGTDQKNLGRNRQLFVEVTSEMRRLDQV